MESMHQKLAQVEQWMETNQGKVFIKSVRENGKIKNIDDKNMWQYFCFFTACCFFNNVDVIRFLHEQNQIDSVTLRESDFFFSVCKINNSMDMIKYLVEDIGVDIEEQDENGNTCLHIASAHNKLHTIEYLIKEKSMDPMIKNNQGMDCLMMTCCNTKHGVDVLNYYVDVMGMNLHGMNNYGQNCLAIACQKADLDLIRYLIENRGMNPLLKDVNQTDCLTTAIHSNRSIDVIKYLVNFIGVSAIKKRYGLREFEKEITHISNDLDVCDHDVCDHNVCDHNVCDWLDMLIACENNPNVDVIKYLVEIMRIGSDNQLNWGCFRRACMSNGVDVVKYLFSIEDVDEGSKRALLLCASRYNQNVDVTKYLVKELNYMTDGRDNQGNNCLLLACKNSNVHVLRYMVEELNMDLNVKNNNSDCCLTFSFYNLVAHDTCQYLIEFTSIPIKIPCHVPMKKYKSVLSTLYHNPQRINELIKKGIKRFGCESFCDIIDGKKYYCVNPLIFDSEVRELTGVDPYEFEHKIFVTYVDALRCKVPLPDCDQKNENCHNQTGVLLIGKNEKELLFTNNGISYYGSRDMVYRAIPLLNDMHQNLNYENPIDLSILVPRYIMEMYIDSCVNGRFDVNQIKQIDFLNFLKLIDQYPTSYLSINGLEKQLIRYMDMNLMMPDIEINHVLSKYHLKLMYMYSNDKLDMK